MRFLRKTTLQYLKQRRSNTLQSLPNNLPVSFCDDVYMPDAIRQEVQDLIVPYEPWKDVLNSYWTLACAIISFNPGNSSPNGAGNDSRQQGYRKGRAMKYRELDDAKKLQEIRFKVESTYVKSSMDLEISLTRGADDHNWKVKGVYQEWAVEEPINQFANCVYWNEYERSTYMKSLTEYTATETWTSNAGVSNATPYNLLENYLSLAFCRLKYQDRIVIRTDKNGTWAAFHTGLFSKYNDDIYCLLSRKTGDKDQAKNLRHWHVEGFCTRHEPICGIGYRGNNKFFLVKKLSDMPTVPAPPTYPLYMNNGLLNEHIAGVRDFSKINYDHIILDNNDRLPIRLLWMVLMNELMPESNGKEHIIDHWPDPALIVDKDDREQFHSIARQLLSSDHSLMQSMRSHLDHAIDEAVQTMRSSHSIVVGYDPRDTDSIVKMLPLRFSDFKDSPTCALVIKENGRQCEARTVFTLDYAYGCARTVCKPTAPWVLAVLSK